MGRLIHDRLEAGHLLAAKLRAYRGRTDVVLLGLARGGVEVARGIADDLKIPLDVLLVRKLGVPGYPELAMGAIASGNVRIIDSTVVEAYGLSKSEVESVTKAERQELERRERVYRGNRQQLDLRGCAAILVDDGMATGSTMRAAIAAARKAGAARVIIAAGVAPFSTYLILSSEADEVVCLRTPRAFWSVSQFYEEFPQLTDDDVVSLLAVESAEGKDTAA